MLEFSIGGADTCARIELTQPRRKFVSTLKKGDVVDVMYTEALAVDVSEAKDKSK